MRRRGWARLSGAALLTSAVAFTTGCVVFGGTSTIGQNDIGPVQVGITPCAIGSAPGACATTGPVNGPVPGTGQLLLGLELSANVDAPDSITSIGPEALAFAQSPSYTSELQRLAPAPTGLRWVGFISAVTNYSDTGGPQSAPLRISLGLVNAPGGAPLPGPVVFAADVGGRQVTADAPGTRPVTCGTDLRTAFIENPSSPQQAVVVCADSRMNVLYDMRNLGVLTPSAVIDGAPGSLAIVPFTVRYVGDAVPTVTPRFSATTTLPQATIAVTPEAVTPPSDSDTSVFVAVGVPAGARPGTYDVTLTADDSGTTRVGVGRLRVTAAGTGGGAAGRAANGGTGLARRARLRLTTILPRGLSAAVARRRGITLLLGATRTGLARVQLFQGRAKKPRVSKRVRLRVPGPVRVVLKSAALVRGRYRVVISVAGRTIVRRAALTR